MLRPRLLHLAVWSFLMLVWLSGCDKGGTQPAAAPPAANTAGGDTPTKKEQDETAAIAKSLAKLSPEDRAAAEAQKVCPVSGEKLGAGLMGAPIKVTVKGQTVFLCCSGCKEDIEKDPDKYLAKLKK